MTWKFDGRHWKTIVHLFYMSSPCFISKPSVNLSWSYSPETVNLGQNLLFFVPSDLKIWRMTLKNHRAPISCYFKVCASFYSHLSIESGITVQKHSIWVKICDFFPCDLEIWRMTLKNNRAPLLCYFKLCTSLRRHLWIQTGVTVRKHQIWDKISNFFHVWPWNLTDDIEKQ